MPSEPIPQEPIAQKPVELTEPTAKVPTKSKLPEIVQNRPVAYEALFEGELPYNPQPNESDIGLAGLWRAYTEKRGGHAIDLQDILDTVPIMVRQVLTEHQRTARSGNPQAEAIFGLVDPDKSLPILCNIVTQAMTLWEKALYRHNNSRLLRTAEIATPEAETKTQLSQIQQERLVHLLTDKSLITEIAAAAMQALPDYTNKPLNPSQKEQTDIARLLANWGPKFVSEWMNGTIIHKWLDTQNLSPADRQDWLDIFTPGLRKRFAVYNINDPLAALEQVKTNLEQKLTDEQIAEHLDWSKAEVAAIFTPSLRKHFAVHNIADPLAGVKDYVDGKITYAGSYFRKP